MYQNQQEHRAYTKEKGILHSGAHILAVPCIDVVAETVTGLSGTILKITETEEYDVELGGQGKENNAVAEDVHQHAPYAFAWFLGNMAVCIDRELETAGRKFLNKKDEQCQQHGDHGDGR